MSFFVPNSSIAGILWAAGFVFFLPFFIRAKKNIFFFFLITTLAIMGLLIASNSRSGWLGCLCGVGYLLNYIDSKAGVPKRGIAFGVMACLIGSLLSLLFYKPDSSLGRKHIYTTSATILKDNWISGIGIGKFRAKFNEYQADYFSSHDINSQRALLADNTFYAFNDYLQWVIETGVVGFLMMVLAFYFISSRVHLIFSRKGTKTIIVAATAALVCIGVAALFSYPLQVIPVQALALAAIGIIIFYPVKADEKSLIIRVTHFIFKGAFVFLAAFFLINSFHVIQRKIAVKEAFDLSMSGFKKQAIAKYQFLIDKFPRHGDIIYLYAEQLYYSNRLTEALSAVNEAKKYYVDNKVYSLKGKIEEELGMTGEAEKSYLHALYMVPNRMRSRFDLFNFYLNQNDTNKAIYWANSILTMPVKVPSEITANLQKQTKELLLRIHSQ